MTIARDAIKSLERSLTFDARDWSKNRCDAWIYGVIIDGAAP